MPPQDAFWDNQSKRYNTAIQDHDAAYKKRIQQTSALLKSTDIVLDFGCASGEIALDIAPHVAKIHGIDLSEKMIELASAKARERGVSNASFSQADIFDQRLDGQMFTAVLAFNIFHLVYDAPKVLARLYNLLDPGGVLISETACLGAYHWLPRSILKLAGVTGLVPAITILTTAKLELLISDRNFKILESNVLSKKQHAQWVVAKK